MNIDVMPPTPSFFCRFITTYDFLLRMDIPDNIFIFGSCHIDNIHNRHKVTHGELANERHVAVEVAPSWPHPGSN